MDGTVAVAGVLKGVEAIEGVDESCVGNIMDERESSRIVLERADLAWVWVGSWVSINSKSAGEVRCGYAE